jgi:CHAD domain-containing protein
MTLHLTERAARFQQMRTASTRRLDKETVHQLRVSIRRLQAVLRLMGQTGNRRALRPLMQLAGAVRNCDITLELVRAAALAPGHAAYSQLRTLRRQRAALLKRAVLDFTLPELHGSELVPSPRLLKEFFRAGREAMRHLTEERLHALRLAGKRLRYTVELLDPSAVDRLRELKRLQEELGAINDCATARLLVDDTGFHHWLANEQERHLGRFKDTWRCSFGVLGARESWQLFLKHAGTTCTGASTTPAQTSLVRNRQNRAAKR